jgi:Flp pilus assembly protein TadG
MRKMKIRRGLFSLLHCLVKDESASILLQFTVYMSVTFGMIGLALDGGRYLLLNNDLQDLADAAALAGAAELDGNNGAIARATDAANNYIQRNNPRWSDIAGVKIQSVAFYSALSPGGDTPTNTDSNASFIKVTTGSWQVAPSFLVAVGAVTNNSTNATAMAGTQFVTCKAVQSYICGPNFPASTQPGAMFRLFSDPTSGNWGVLDDPACQTPDCYTSVFAKVAPNACTTAKGHQNTGNAVAKRALDGINVRFDRPQGSGDLSTSAPVVIDGYSNATCGKKWTSVNPANFDPDTNYSVCSAGSCPLPRNSSNLNVYWQNQHGSILPAGISTRYDAYRCELGLLPGVAGCPPASWTQSAETAAPTCSATTLTGSAGLSRRIISIAIIDNCPSGNSGDDFIYSKYADFFLTEVADSSGNGYIYAEYIKTNTAYSAGSQLRKTVKLYR